MNVFLWGLQIVCAAIFIRYGIRKVMTPKGELQRQVAWVEDYSSRFVKFIGSVEILGGIGLVLPAATRVAPVLTPIAACGLAVLMILGARLHISRREYREMLQDEPWFFTAFCLIAWGRFGPYA